MAETSTAGAPTADDKLEKLKREAEAEMGRAGPQELEGRASKRPRFSGEATASASQVAIPHSATDVCKL